MMSDDEVDKNGEDTTAAATLVTKGHRGPMVSHRKITMNSLRIAIRCDVMTTTPGEDVTSIGHASPMQPTPLPRISLSSASSPIVPMCGIACR